MSVFIPYIPRDAELAEGLAAGLTARGCQVVHHAVAINAVNLQHMQNAKAIIILWTPQSAQSGEMLQVAQYAAEHGKLVAVRIGVMAGANPFITPQDYLYSDLDGIAARLRQLGACQGQTKPGGWNPFVVLGILIGIFLLFFAYLSLPSPASCTTPESSYLSCR